MRKMKLGFLTVAFENLELKEFSDKIVHTHAKDTEILSEGLYENGIYGSVFQDGKNGGDIGYQALGK